MDRDTLAQQNSEMLFADGFDEALIGTTDREGVKVALYSTSKCIDVLKKEMSHEEAVEYFYFNVEGAYVGPNTPCFVDDLGF
jgi:hypothetical protein